MRSVNSFSFINLQSLTLVVERGTRDASYMMTMQTRAKLTGHRTFESYDLNSETEIIIFHFCFS